MKHTLKQNQIKGITLKKNDLNRIFFALDQVRN